MTKELLNNIQLEKEIDKNLIIGLKSNLVVAKDSLSGATTSPEIIKGIIEYL